MNEPKVDLKLPSMKGIVVPAAPWKRALSFLFDMTIIMFIISPFTSVLSQEMMMSPDFISNFEYITGNPEIYSKMSFISVAISLIVLAYFVSFEFKLRQTPGKMLFRLTLVPFDKKEDLTFIRIMIRNLAAVPVSVLSLLLIIDPVYLIFTGRRLSDLFSKSTIAEENIR